MTIVIMDIKGIFAHLEGVLNTCQAEVLSIEALQAVSAKQ